MRCSKRSSAAQIGSTAEAADPPPSLADLPVVDMERVDPVKYKTASELAARGSAPLDIALKIVGAFEGATQHIIQINAGSEAPSASRLTVLRDRLMDDSIRGARWDITLERTTASLWRIWEVRRAWRCWRGEKTNGFASNLCP